MTTPDTTRPAGGDHGLSESEYVALDAAMQEDGFDGTPLHTPTAVERILAARAADAAATDEGLRAAVEAVVARMRTRQVDHRHEDEVGHWGVQGRAYFYAGDIYDDYADLTAALDATPAPTGPPCEVHVPGRDAPSPWCAACRLAATEDREGWRDTTLAELRASARRIIRQIDAGCTCPDAPHQNALHDLAVDLADLPRTEDRADDAAGERVDLDAVRREAVAVGGCNDRCDGDSHWLMATDPLAEIRPLTSLGAVTLHVNGVGYIRQIDLLAAMNRADAVAQPDDAEADS